MSELTFETVSRWHNGAPKTQHSNLCLIITVTGILKMAYVRLTFDPTGEELSDQWCEPQGSHEEAGTMFHYIRNAAVVDYYPLTDTTLEAVESMYDSYNKYVRAQNDLHKEE